MGDFGVLGVGVAGCAGSVKGRRGEGREKSQGLIVVCVLLLIGYTVQNESTSFLRLARTRPEPAWLERHSSSLRLWLSLLRGSAATNP
jgi:hypothetical protein